MWRFGAQGRPRSGVSSARIAEEQASTAAACARVDPARPIRSPRGVAPDGESGSPEEDQVERKRREFTDTKPEVPSSKRLARLKAEAARVEAEDSAPETEASAAEHGEGETSRAGGDPDRTA